MESNTMEEVKLKRRFNLVQSIAILTGLIIGAGIYVSPAYVMQMVAVPGVTLLLWVVAGCINILESLIFAELGTTYTTIGDCYVYLDIFYGDFVAFMFLWGYLFVTRTGSNALKCLLAGAYLTTYFFPGCSAPEIAIKLIAIVILGMMTFLNGVNVKLSGRVQAACAFITTLSLVVIIITGIVYVGKGNTEHVHDIFIMKGDIDIGSMFLTVYAMIWSYGGWFALNYMVEEVKDPVRTIPRAVIITMVVVIVLYVLTNVSLLAVLGAEGIRQSQAVAMTFSEQTMGRASMIIALAIAVACCGSLNSGTLVGSRLGYAGSRRGHLPAALSFINMKAFAPVVALLVQMIIVFFMILFCDIYTLLSNTTFLSISAETLTVYGLIYRRIKEPDLHRPFKICVVSWICKLENTNSVYTRAPVVASLPIWMICFYAIISTVLVVVPLITNPYDAAMGIVIVLVTGVPYYAIFVMKMLPMNAGAKYNRLFVVTLQKLLWSAPQDRPHLIHEYKIVNGIDTNN